MGPLLAVDRTAWKAYESFNDPHCISWVGSGESSTFHLGTSLRCLSLDIHWIGICDISLHIIDCRFQAASDAEGRFGYKGGGDSARALSDPRHRWSRSAAGIYLGRRKRGFSS